MAENERRETELVLAPNEYAFVLDKTKGQVNTCVGPYKGTVSTTEQPVIYDEKARRYRPCQLDQAVQEFVYVPEGHYVVLENPADGSQNPPPVGTPTQAVKLQVGRKVNIPGPCTFPLWPGQAAQVLDGHHLRSNQYLLVRVYNEDAARANWEKAVVKPQAPSGSEPTGEEPPMAAPATEPPDLTMGKLMVIEGTEVSFYIPPTGIEVLPEPRGSSNYVQDAVTLEQLEYCILLNEDGRKRYINGPAVVFPKPTEQFVEHNGNRKFRAYELSDTTGIYLRVIAPYTDEAGEYAVGEELFLSGDATIYFPRPEHAIIRYRGQADPRIFAVAIPEGQGRYVLSRQTGAVSIVRGPTMFLPDPRKEVVVKRILSDKQVGLWFPASDIALQYNRDLRVEADQSAEPLESDDELSVRSLGSTLGARRPVRFRDQATEGYIGDQFDRSTTFTPPRTIIIDDRYEGAVKVSVWTGYGVQTVRSNGERRVVVGPQDVLLEHDETLEVLELSTGKPKTTDRLLKTVYLRTANNTVSDVVRAETRDLCSVDIKLSYRVNFEGDSGRWFGVENYVKFLCDHLKSMIKNMVQHLTIEEFYRNAADLIRDLILGKAREGENGKRPGRVFDENGMRVYDVEVLFVEIKNDTIRDRLQTDQFQAITQSLESAALERKLKLTQERERINQEVARAEAETTKEMLRLHEEAATAEHALAEAKTRFETLEEEQKLQAREDKQPRLDAIAQAELIRIRAAEDQQLALKQKALELDLLRLKAETAVVREKAEAITPDLIGALTTFSERDLVAKATIALGPLTIFGGNSVAEIVATVFADTPLANLMKKPNGSPSAAVAPRG